MKLRERLSGETLGELEGGGGMSNLHINYLKLLTTKNYGTFNNESNISKIRGLKHMKVCEKRQNLRVSDST